MTDAEIIGEFDDYEGMLAVVRLRAVGLKLHGTRFDTFAGLPEGYLSKLIGAHPVRRIGMTSLGPLFQALGIKCIVVADPAATERLKARVKPRDVNQVRKPAALNPEKVISRYLRRLNRRSRKAYLSKTTPEQRRRIARKAARARWRPKPPPVPVPPPPAVGNAEPSSRA